MELNIFLALLKNALFQKSLSPEEIQLSEKIFFLVSPLAALFLLISHLYFSDRPREKSLFITDLAYLAFFPLLVLVLLLALQSENYPIHLRDILGFVALFGSVVCVSVSEVLLRGLAKYLNRNRRDRWIKELDYVYLLLGALGLFFSVDRLATISDRIIVPDFYGAMLGAAALAVRAIKTRADIGRWQQL